jgi:hypothetical protein
LYSRVRKHISASDLRKLNENLTLKFRDQLNPTFWDVYDLKPNIRTALLRFADAFAEYVELDSRAIKDVLMLGGNAGYNYTGFSDVDVHLVVDPKFIPHCDPELLDSYFMDKKTLWSLTHDVKIYGSDVEPYIEKPGVTRRKSQGVYSILKNKWVQQPQKFEGELDEAELEKKANNIKNKIDTLIRGNNETGLRAILKKLGTARNSSLDKFGEYGFENLVFKELRNSGYIDKVRKAVVELKAQKLSLP